MQLLDLIRDRWWVLRQCASRVCVSLPAALLLLEYGLAHSDWAHFLQLRRTGSLSTTCPPPSIIPEGFTVESTDECRLCVLRARLLLHRQRLYTFVRLHQGFSAGCIGRSSGSRHVEASAASGDRWIGVHSSGVQYPTDDFLSFIHADLLACALASARRSDVRCVATLVAEHPLELAPHQLRLLEEASPPLPGYCGVANYLHRCQRQ